MTNPIVTHTLAGAALLSALVLAACGGGSGGSASTAASSSVAQTASGTVTGFGSVYVDGVEIEDARATTRVENADGSYSATALQLGQRVRVAHDGSGTASGVTVDAAVIGAVASHHLGLAAQIPVGCSVRFQVIAPFFEQVSA